MTGILYIARVRDDAPLPKRSHDSDAGMDLYIPYKWNNGEEYTIQPGETVIIPSGLTMTIVEEGYYGFIVVRSSIARRGLVLNANIIDRGFDGEFHYDIHNISSEPHILVPGTRIAQLIIQAYLPVEIVEADREFVKSWNARISARGDGGFGSTGTK